MSLMRVYDLILLLDSEMPEDGREKTIKDVEKAISSADCKIVKSDDWGVKKLAFQINHRNDAHYFLIRIEAPAQEIEGLGKKLRIMDGILRFRTIKQPNADREEWIDFKDYVSLRRFLSDRGKIRTKRVCRVSRRKMAMAVNAIKQARELALLPYETDR